jgi:hypothetical protein
MGKSINPMCSSVPEAKSVSTPPPAFHRLDEFAASYSLAGCSPALPASALPASFILRPLAETVNQYLRGMDTQFSGGFDFALAETHRAKVKLWLSRLNSHWPVLR